MGSDESDIPPDEQAVERADFPGDGVAKDRPEANHALAENPSSAPVTRALESAAPARQGDASGPAIAATVALVLFSVFIGVLGPRLGNRPQSPAGVTLVELAEAMRSRSMAQVNELDAARHPGMSLEEFAYRLDEITDSSVAIPSLEALGLQPTTVQRVRLPGGSGGLAVLRRKTRVGQESIAVAVLRDEDRFTVYDRYGRPMAMPEGEIFTISDRNHDVAGTVEVYREGDVVIVVHAASGESARTLVGALRSANADRRASLVEQQNPEHADVGAAGDSAESSDRGKPE